MASLIKILDNAKFLSKTVFGDVSPNPTYQLGSSLASVNEGSSVVFTLSTTNVSDGTLVPYVITGVSLADLASGALTGNFTVASGLASASITLAADALTEGSETMTVSLSSGVASASVVVNDTSKTPLYSLTSSSASVNEGSSVTFTLSTANVANGTVLPYVITGISSSDLSSGSLTGSFTVSNGSASTSITLANDVLTEGTETATLSTAVGSVAVTVNDTSRTPTYAIGRSLSAVDEGSSVVFTLSTTNVANGTVLPYTISGISSADVTTGSLTGSFTVSNNLATATITMSADQLTEGAETVTLTLNNAAASNFVLVNDTSLTPAAFSPDQITGLRGWYDAAEGVYQSNGNDFVDDSTASFTLNSGAAFGSTTASITINTSMGITINGKNDYLFTVSYITGGAAGVTGTVSWNGSAWVCNYNVPDQFDSEGELTMPAYSGSFSATGNTTYPWQANWGAGKSATRTATINSSSASVGQTIAKWKNKVKALSNPYGGHLIQISLGAQPILRNTSDTNKKYLEFDRKGTNNTSFTGITTAQRTYYIVAFNQGSSSSAPVLASSVSTIPSARRIALSYNPLTGVYGLSQGTNKFSAIEASFDHIVCASFNSSATGKISVNNSSEETLTGIGSSFTASTSLYVGTNNGSGTLMNVKEILFFEGAHTTAQKTQVINYLNAKHNVF